MILLHREASIWLRWYQSAKRLTHLQPCRHPGEGRDPFWGMRDASGHGAARPASSFHSRACCPMGPGLRRYDDGMENTSQPF